MKPRWVGVMVCMALACGAGPWLATRAADATEVVAQRLAILESSKKISAAFWTRRADRYTLQLVLPQRPAVTVWLLRGDGTSISLSRATPLTGKNDAVPIEVAYWVPLSSGEEAVAVVARIGDEYFIEPLHPLGE